MTRRDDLKEKLLGQLTKEALAVSATTSEFTEQLEVNGLIGGRSVRILITKYPLGENPESYDGDEMWSVQLFDENGEQLDRYHNPESSLEIAFQMIDWDRVQDALDQD
jgi:hypothetical protein